jgi:parvulin-like peptidyl-prolyl isomerase
VTRLRSLPLFFLALVVASSAWLAACSGGRSGVALTVNGVTLSNDEFTSWLSALTSANAIGSTFDSTVKGTYSTNLTTALLNQQVEFAVVRSELDRRNITLTSADLSSAESTAAQNLAGTSTDASGQQVAGDPSKGKALLDKLGAFKDDYVRFVAGQTALEKAYATERGSTASLRKLYEKNHKAFENQACVTVLEVLASTQADASGNPVTPTSAQLATARAKTQQIRDSIKTDADFVAAAQQMATQEGSTNGGDLGCAAKGTYASQAPSLDAAIWSLPVGTVSQPIAVKDGYLLVRVSARGDLTFDEVKSQLQEAAAQQSVTDYQAWLAGAIKKADVAVDPQWGSWNAKTGSVVAPVGATSSIGAKVRSTTSIPRTTTSASTP